MRPLIALALVLIAPLIASAQVQSRPTDPPLVTAEREPWYVQGDPVQFAGNNYYRAGASIFFDGNRMVRTGNFLGIPLYADTTIEPFSLVLVPIGRGLMQPYERPRDKELAGTVGSRAPSFPVSGTPSGSTQPMAPSPPTSLVPFLLNESPATADSSGRTRAAAPAAAGDNRTASAAPQQPAATPEEIQAVREKVWVEFRGQKWVHAGAAIPLAGSGLVKTGEYAGFPVYVRQDGSSDTRIYLPALADLVTPYELKR
jgi:hypothetical protein